MLKPILDMTKVVSHTVAGGQASSPVEPLVRVIMVMQTTGNGNVKYWLALSSHDWLERGAASWPIDKTATGWSRSELRLFVRPNALRMWWILACTRRSPMRG